jgi:hypothetical protein
MYLLHHLRIFLSRFIESIQNEDSRFRHFVLEILHSLIVTGYRVGLGLGRRSITFSYIILALLGLRPRYFFHSTLV